MSERQKVNLFERQWQSYRLVLSNNLMGHRELIREASKKLKQVFIDRPVAMADLGCGDCCLIPELTSTLNTRSFYVQLMRKPCPITIT